MSKLLVYGNSARHTLKEMNADTTQTLRRHWVKTPKRETTRNQKEQKSQSETHFLSGNEKELGVGNGMKVCVFVCLCVCVCVCM